MRCASFELPHRRYLGNKAGEVCFGLQRLAIRFGTDGPSTSAGCRRPRDAVVRVKQEEHGWHNQLNLHLGD